jgi:hypothetical protein
MRRGVMEQMVSLISLGDGSTLSLDFTTGVLDPRLTFTRASNATFINSSGFVEWSASNHAPRTNWNFTSPTGSGWNAATLSGTGTFQWVGNGTVIAASGSAGQAFTIITTPTGIAEGLRYVMSVTASSVTGSPTIQSIFDFTSASGNTYFKNGAAATAGTTVASGDRISVSAIASSTSMNVRLGCGAWFANRTNESVTLTQFHWHPGSAPVAYYENTGTSPRYDSARFDHDPTTLAPRGLLVEGQVPTLNAYSEDFSNAYWSKPNASVSSTSVTGPDNVAGTTRRIVEDNTTNQHGLRRQFSMTSGVTYTMSVFVKPGSYDSFGFEMYASASNNAKAEVTSISGNTQTVTSASGVNATLARTPMAASGWYRYALTFTSTATQSGDFNILIKQTNSYAGNGTNYMDVYGFMLETGSGASSYIPTGASTATRNEDSATMAITAAPLGFDLYRYTMRVRGRQNKFGVSFARSLRLHDASTEQIGLPVNNNTLYGTSRNASNNAIAEVSAAATLNQDFRFAWALDANLATNTMLGSLNQSPLSSSRTATGPMGSTTTLAFNTNAAATAYASITIRDVKFWPRQMTASELNALTAP